MESKIKMPDPEQLFNIIDSLKDCVRLLQIQQDMMWKELANLKYIIKGEQ